MVPSGGFVRLQYEKIGDVMRKLTPFLKLYTEYVKDFQKASALVDTYEEKSSAFAAALKDIRVGICMWREGSLFAAGLKDIMVGICMWREGSLFAAALKDIWLGISM